MGDGEGTYSRALTFVQRHAQKSSEIPQNKRILKNRRVVRVKGMIVGRMVGVAY